ncbi:hypothetical protein, partial [Mycobacteroides abscessus]|uniref:hypothetical protein n=1 Tax=Mycobacteroides abscessus TaxID=36809 RepID=UPI001A95D0C5
MPDTTEPPAGQTGTTCRTRRNHRLDPPERPLDMQNHLPATPETLGEHSGPAGHAKITCQLRQYHLADTVETPVGPAGTTSQTCQNHVHEMLEP